MESWAVQQLPPSFVDEGSKRDWIETLDTAFAAA